MIHLLYNLVHFLEPYCKELTVYRNDEINYDKISVKHKILLSPGPGFLKIVKIFKVIDKFQFTNNIMGVCLGFQAIGQFYGANLTNLKNVRHGIQTEINILNHDCIFRDLPTHFKIGHYHSWIIDKIPNILNITVLLIMKIIPWLLNTGLFRYFHNSVSSMKVF